MIVQLFGTFPSAADAPVIAGAQRWMVSTAYRRLPGQPFDVIFEMHPDDEIDRLNLWDDFVAHARAGKRVVMLTQHPRIPSSEAYPLSDIQREFGDMGQPLGIETSFQSTVDFMLALAIYRGATWIDVQGVDMRNETEYQSQRETFRYWQGIARGRGIRVTVPVASGLDSSCLMYGYYTDSGLPGPPGEVRVLNGHPAEMVTV